MWKYCLFTLCCCFLYNGSERNRYAYLVWVMTNRSIKTGIIVYLYFHDILVWDYKYLVCSCYKTKWYIFVSFPCVRESFCTIWIIINHNRLSTEGGVFPLLEQSICYHHRIFICLFVFILLNYESKCFLTTHCKWNFEIRSNPTIY